MNLRLVLCAEAEPVPAQRSTGLRTPIPVTGAPRVAALRGCRSVVGSERADLTGESADEVAASATGGLEGRRFRAYDSLDERCWSGPRRPGRLS
jgi:hypothetical protein